MGVPKFYRWISERYPKINEIISDSALLPEFDHLYLDMNGIIHGCTHPSHLDVSDVLSEREMMLGIMHYLDRLISQIVKPKVSVYMAIDGVAPRAKLNQQRSRRFRSAKDLAAQKEEMNKKQPAQQDDNNNNNKSSLDVFDSNCITPGTEFLEKVSKVIQYFIRKKIKEDPLWRNLTVIFSGHDIPGEGEHKIMQHIRDMCNQPGWSPNARHCIYGQDADLMMLGLITHQPHFSILREVVDFGAGFDNQKNTLKAVKKFTKQSDFQLLHLSVLRDYLEMEFMYKQPQYDLERIIDDFVFMTFLVGNDFLPHLNALDISDGAFDLLFGVYKEQRLTWGQGEYLTHSGEIPDPARLEAFLRAVGKEETEILEQREKDAAAYVKKKRRWDRRDGKEEGPSDAELAAMEAGKQESYLAMVETMMAKAARSAESADGESPFVEGWKPVSAPGEKDFKGRYYYEKLKLTPMDKKEHWALRRSYMEGLLWCLAYYYRGCISWGWYYPYHYGPMLSDLINVPKMFDEIRFEIGAPLRPFEQLMACLPPLSRALVPKVYQQLMTSPDSPIIHFYPENFEVDMNGKRNPWEGVNLLPFIDSNLLIDTILVNCPDSRLTPAERRRNLFGDVYCYKYDAACVDKVEPPIRKIGLPEISESHSSVKTFKETHHESTPTVSFKPALAPGTQIPFPGFPSLNVIPIASVEVKPVGLNCFGTASKYPNMILTLHEMPELPSISDLASNILGRSLFINWPMMHEGRVVAISDENQEVRLVKKKPKAKRFSDTEKDRWLAASETMQQTYCIGNGIPGSGGLEIGSIKYRLKLLPLQGMKTNAANGSTKKVFGRDEADVPMQLALWKSPAPDPRFIERGPQTLQDRFPPDSRVVLTKGKYRGCRGVVVGIADEKHIGIRVETLPAELPFGLAIARSVRESFVSASDAARILRIRPDVFGKITGRLQFEQDRYDLGLNLKSNNGLHVIGYTRKKEDKNDQTSKDKTKNRNVWEAGDSVRVIGSTAPLKGDEPKDERIQWEYSPKAVRLVDEYRRRYPRLFEGLARSSHEKKYDAVSVFGPNGGAWLPEIREWLDNHESAKLPRTPVTTDSMSYEAIAAVQKAADVRTLALKKKGFPKESLIKIPGSALYREGSTGPTDLLLASDLNNNEAPELGDRIVNLCAEGIPFGMRGTIVGIHEAATTGSVEVVMDEEFLSGSTLQGACSNYRGKLCVWAHLLKIAPENSKSLVDKLVPKGSGRAAVDKILTSIDRQVKSHKTGKLQNQWDGKLDPAVVSSGPDSHQASLAAEEAKNNKEKKPADTKTPPVASEPIQPSNAIEEKKGKAKAATPPRSSSRHGSTGRGRQGAWREARGPPDGRGSSFKRGRKGCVSGFDRWIKLLETREAEKAREVADEAAMELKSILGVASAPSTDDELKALLGVVSSIPSVPLPEPRRAENGMMAHPEGDLHPGSASVTPFVEPGRQLDVPAVHQAVTAAGLELTSNSGKRNKMAAPNISEPASRPAESDAAAGLKAMLGVGGGSVEHATSAPSSAPPASAADRLLQLMAAKQATTPMVGPSFHVGPTPPQPSAFNFTYVNDGQAPPPPAMPHQQFPSFVVPPVYHGPAMPHQMPVHGFPQPNHGAGYMMPNPGPAHHAYHPSEADSGVRTRPAKGPERDGSS